MTSGSTKVEVEVEMEGNNDVTLDASLIEISRVVSVLASAIFTLLLLPPSLILSHFQHVYQFLLSPRCVLQHYTLLNRMYKEERKWRTRLVYEKCKYNEKLKTSSELNFTSKIYGKKYLFFSKKFIIS